MKCALVCIAKNEDRYIKEWALYHLKLGFDKIYIYCDHWSCPPISDKRVRISNIEIEGAPPQIPVYNYALDCYRDAYDWIAFFDVDEFLVLKKHDTIQEFLEGRSETVGINWKLFGDNGLTDSGEDGVLLRFTKCQSTTNQHVKCIIKCSPDVEMVDPHSPNTTWLGSDGDTHQGPFCPNGNIEEAQLNHYFCKTREEWKLKQARGGADGYYRRPDSDFDKHNFNEVEDFSAKNFFFDLEKTKI